MEERRFRGENLRYKTVHKHTMGLLREKKKNEMKKILSRMGQVFNDC
jgi:hypothetical protein